MAEDVQGGKLLMEIYFGLPASYQLSTYCPANLDEIERTVKDLLPLFSLALVKQEPLYAFMELFQNDV